MCGYFTFSRYLHKHMAPIKSNRGSMREGERERDHPLNLRKCTPRTRSHYCSGQDPFFFIFLLKSNRSASTFMLCFDPRHEQNSCVVKMNNTASTWHLHAINIKQICRICGSKMNELPAQSLHRYPSPGQLGCENVCVSAAIAIV